MNISRLQALAVKGPRHDHSHSHNPPPKESPQQRYQWRWDDEVPCVGLQPANKGVVFCGPVNCVCCCHLDDADSAWTAQSPVRRMWLKLSSYFTSTALASLLTQTSPRSWDSTVLTVGPYHSIHALLSMSCWENQEVNRLQCLPFTRGSLYAHTAS